MKKLLAVFIVLSLICLCACGTPADVPVQSGESETSAAALTPTPEPEPVTITVLRGKYADVIYALADMYTQKYPHVTITFSEGAYENPSQFAATGAQVAFCMQTQTQLAAHPELKHYLMVGECVGIVVNRHNQAEGLSSEQLKRLLAGEITNWSEVGGEEKPITVYPGNMREYIDVLSERLGEGIPILSRFECEIGDIMVDGSGGVSILRVSPAADTGPMANSGVESTKVLRIDGIYPTMQAVQSGEYPLVKKYYLLTSDEPDAATAAFIDYLLHDAEVKTYLEQYGYCAYE